MSPETEEQDDVNEVALEKILSMFKLLGPYYRRFMPFLIFATLTNSFYCMNYVLVAVPVDYRCKYESERNHTVNESNLDQTLDECYQHLMPNDSSRSGGNVNLTKVTCNDVVYDEPESFVAEFNLGCQEWKRILVGTVHNFGYMLGLLLQGPVSDKLGRKRLIVFLGISGGILGISKSVTSSYWVFIALEFSEAMIGDAYSSTYMLGVEMFAKQIRIFFGPLLLGTISLGGVLFATIAWLVPNWRIMTRIIYAPTALFILHAYFLDESVRWLLIKGKKEEAKNILRKAAEKSNIRLDEETLDCLESEKSAENTDLITLLRMTTTSRKLLVRFLACVCIWITAAFNKYSLLINSVSLEGNKYLNYALIAFADFPASVILVFTFIKFKRRGPLIFSFLITGFICITQSLLPKGYPVLSMTLFFTGKIAASQSYGMIYLYTAELFPTCTRNTMNAVCSSVGRIGSILATQTPLLIQSWTGLPTVIIGSLSLITSVIVILMPDTAEDVLPDTIKEAEALGQTKIIDEKLEDKKAAVKLLE